jgi:hypothetical protein
MDIRQRDNYHCARCGFSNALHTHHRKLRSQGGRDDYATCVTLCARCHHWAHHNVSEAHEAGWLVWSWEDPTKIPVRHHDWPAGAVLLHLDGTVGLGCEE